MREEWASISLTWPVLQDVRLVLPGERGVPLLLGFSPSPVTGVMGAQPLLLTGVGFEPRPAPIVVFTNLSTSEEIRVRPRTTTATQLLVMLDTTDQPATWTAKVLNANGTVSYPLAFSVLAPP